MKRRAFRRSLRSCKRAVLYETRERERAGENERAARSLSPLLNVNSLSER